MKTTTKSPKDGATRQEEFREKQRKLGRRRHEYWLTPDEIREVALLLARLRS